MLAGMRPSARLPHVYQFAVSGHDPILELRRADALDLLEWLGLGRPEFGAIEIKDILPLCKRRLWPLPRNVDPATPTRTSGSLRHYAMTLADRLAGEPNAVLLFG
jgi:hypothetical protein